MNNKELTDNELKAVLELIIDNNEYNDEDHIIEFWNDIVRKLDPDQKYAEDAELKGGKNHPATSNSNNSEKRMTCVICDNKTDEGNRFPTDDKGNYSQEEGHFWTCETCFENTESILDAEEERNQLIEDKKRKGQINMGSIRYGGEDGAY